MKLFKKKDCDICGEKIGLLGNKKLEDGNMCKNCEKLLSRHFSNRRKTTIADIKEHLAYREENKNHVAAFNTSRVLGGYTRVLLDEDAEKFVVTSFSDWQSQNPDVINFSQVIGCKTETRGYTTEIKRKDKEGKEVSYIPARYEYDYDFFVTIQVNSPWFDEMHFSINDGRVKHRTSIEYREMEGQLKEIEETMTKIREEARQSKNRVGEPGPATSETTASPKAPQKCPYCGSMTTPNDKNCCEFCGGEMQG